MGPRFTLLRFRRGNILFVVNIAGPLWLHLSIPIHQTAFVVHAKRKKKKIKKSASKTQQTEQEKLKERLDRIHRRIPLY